MPNTSAGLPPPSQSQNNVSSFLFLEMKCAEVEAHFFTHFQAHLENYFNWENVSNYVKVNIYLKEEKKRKKRKKYQYLRGLA